MRAAASVIVVFAVAFAALLPGGAAAAQQTNPAHAHVGHVADGWNDTPEGQGLLPTAVAEANVAVQHARLAARDRANLEAMKLHARHVLHAVDPSGAANGPGLGYGVKRAAETAGRHIELAARADGASQNVMTHAGHVAAAIGNTVQRADRIAALVSQIQAAGSASEAAPLVDELVSLAEQLVAGTDANGDGRIGWQEGEGGLQHAEQHVGLLKRGEGIS